MPKIGSVTPDIWNDDGLQVAAAELEDFKHPVLDGDGVIVGGKRSPYAAVHTQHMCATYAAARTLIAGARAIINTFITIDPVGDGGGGSTTKIVDTYVKDVIAEAPKCVSGLSGSNTYLVILHWTFRLPTTWTG